MHRLHEISNLDDGLTDNVNSNLIKATTDEAKESSECQSNMMQSDTTAILSSRDGPESDMSCTDCDIKEKTTSATETPVEKTSSPNKFNNVGEILVDFQSSENCDMVCEAVAPDLGTPELKYKCDAICEIDIRLTSTPGLEYNQCSHESLSMSRRVSFPENDRELVTGYLEPANPWEEANVVKTNAELSEMYSQSCRKHNVKPLQTILSHISAIDVNQRERQKSLTLRGVELSANDCEPLEEIFKRIQYQLIDISECALEESALIALFQMIEYYEAAVELDVSYNGNGMTLRGWLSCNYMLGRSAELRALIASGNPISKLSAESLGSSLNSSYLHTLKLEHCGLKGPPFSGLCFKLSFNKNLKELWLSYNDLDNTDAEVLADMLCSNQSLEILDISNNNIKDDGIGHLIQALIMQANRLRRERSLKGTKSLQRSANFDIEKNSKGTDVSNVVCNEFDNNVLSSSKIVPQRSLLDQLLSMDSEEEVCIATAPGLNESIPQSHHKKSSTFGYDAISDKNVISKIPHTEKIPRLCSESSASCNRDSSVNRDLKCANEICSDINNRFEHLHKPPVFIIGDDEELTLKPCNKTTASQLESLTEMQAKNLGGSNKTDQSQSYDAGGTRQSIRAPPLSINHTSDSIKGSLSELISPSSDSICSDRSIDICSSPNACFNNTLTKNDTLTRRPVPVDLATEALETCFEGLKALTVWNNNLSKLCAQHISRLLSQTTSLEVLNMGKNCLSNDFMESIRDSLVMNKTVTSLGLQSTHLSTPGIESLTSALGADGNRTLQRIDIRNNNINAEALSKIIEVLNINKVLTQFDINDEPKRLPIGSDVHMEYTRLLTKLRLICAHNKSAPLGGATNAPAHLRTTDHFPGKRKISLTCHSEPLNTSLKQQGAQNSLTRNISKKPLSDLRLRSPVPTPIISPATSPHRSRFRVCRVNEKPILPPGQSDTPAESLLKLHASPLSSSCVSIQTNVPDHELSTNNSSFTYGSLPTSGSFAIVPSAQLLSQATNVHISSHRSRFHVSRIFEEPRDKSVVCGNNENHGNNLSVPTNPLIEATTGADLPYKIADNSLQLESKNSSQEDDARIHDDGKDDNINAETSYKDDERSSGLIVECTRKISSTFNQSAVDKLLTLFAHKTDKTVSRDLNDTEESKNLPGDSSYSIVTSARTPLPKWTRVGAEILSAGIALTSEYCAKSNKVVANTTELSRSFLDNTPKLIETGKDMLLQNILPPNESGKIIGKPTAPTSSPDINESNFSDSGPPKDLSLLEVEKTAQDIVTVSHPQDNHDTDCSRQYPT